jgi:site-specific DNA-methyltransferase (adenine-specific)
MKKLYEEYGECIDLCITDPPYGIEYQSNGSLHKKDKLNNDDIVDYKTFGELVYKLLKLNSHAYFFTRFDVYPEHYKQLKEVGFNIKNLIVAEKMQVGGLGDLQASFANNVELIIFAQKGRRKFNHTSLIKNVKEAGKRLNRYANPTSEYKKRLPVLWKVSDGYPPAVLNSSQNKDNPHPTPKNPLFLEWLIELSSNDGDLVIDPFIGSGSLKIACENRNRRYIGYEIDKDFYAYAVNR